MALLIIFGILTGISLSLLTRKVVLDKLISKRFQKKLKQLRTSGSPRFFGFARKLLSPQSKGTIHGLIWGPPFFLLVLSFFAPLGGFVPAMLISSVLFTLGKFLDRDQSLLDYVNDTSRSWAKMSIQELIEEGSDQSVQMLQVAAKSQDEKLRNLTYNFLIEDGDRRATPVLLEGLRTSVAGLRNRIIGALAGINPQALGRQLPALLAHRTSSTRVEAYKYVHLVADEEEAETLLQNGLRDLDGKVRWEAAISFQKFRSRAVLDWLREFRNRPENVRFSSPASRLEAELHGERWQTIKATREAMGEPGNEADLEAILNRLIGPGDAMQAIIERLGEQNTEASIDALVQLLGLKEVDVQRAAASMLSRMGENARIALVESLKSKNYHKRYGAIGALGYMKEGDNTEVILRHLNDPEPKVRQMALRILRNDNDWKVQREILGRTDDNMYEVRVEALSALRTNGTMELVPPLLAKYKRLRKRSWENSASYKINREMGEVGLAIGGIIARQPHKAEEVHSLLCTKCMTRAVIRKEFQWRWPVCRKCNQSQHLIGGVLQVVGQIGGAESLEQNGARALVPLWDEKAKKAQFADLDTLEIISGTEMNYDWAVSAVISTLQNDTTRKKSRIPIFGVEDANLEDNTLRLIREIQA